MKKIIQSLVASVLLLVGGNTVFADCGNVQIAAMNWASAQLIANVDKLILEKGYGSMAVTLNWYQVIPCHRLPP